MTKIQKFTVKGVKSEDISLPKDITGEINLPLLAQAVYVYEDRGHIGLRKTKTRSEVNRTSKKVYKQKGTGGARHGSRRAPIFVGGGVALGPRPVKRVLTLSTDLKNKARIIAYSLKAEEKELVAVSGLGGIKKTKDVAVLTNALGKATGAKRFTFVVSDKAEVVSRCIKNVKIASCVFYKNANAMDIFKGGMIVLDLDVFGAQEKPVEAKAKTIKKTVKEKTAK